MRGPIALSILAGALFAHSAFAQSEVKIGMVTTLSGPAGYLGADVRDGFLLAVDQEGGKLGGIPVRVLVEDDGLKPGQGKEIANRFLGSEKVKVLTGFIFSNVLAAVAQDAFDAEAFVCTELSQQAGLNNVRTEIVSEGTAAAVNFHPVAWRKRIDPAELEHPFSPVIESAKDGEQIWNDHFVALTNWVNNFAAREDAIDVSEPALQHIDVNPKRENVESTNFNPLPPMRRSTRIQIVAGKTLQSHVERTSDVILGQEFFNKQIRPHSHRGRTKHGHQFWITL